MASSQDFSDGSIVISEMIHVLPMLLIGVVGKTIFLRAVALEFAAAVVRSASDPLICFVEDGVAFNILQPGE